MRDQLRWAGDIYLIPNGVAPPPRPAGGGGGDGPVTAAAAQPDGRGSSGGPAALVWVGRLVAHKRADLVLPIAERLAGTGVTVDVVGRGPAAEALAASVADRGLAGQVRLHGFLPEADKQAVVAAARLHLNTSLGEGWGLCVLEAAALGVPTVAFDVAGLRDAVRDGETGWLVRDGDRIEDVTQRAVKELADPVRRAEVAAACRAWAAQLSWDTLRPGWPRCSCACLQRGTSRASQAGAWIVSTRDGGLRLAEGPVLDILAGQGRADAAPAGHPAGAAARPRGRGARRQTVIGAPPLPPSDTLQPLDSRAASERVRGAIRLAAFCLLLQVLPFLTAPGNIIADTKLDLAINPAGFLSRALSLWDPQQFGQLQDQANGYLFPMGPFFVLGKLAALPPWVIQRLWIGALLVAAFLGTVRLAGRLGIGTPWTRIAAGLAYALSPAALTLLGELSSEWLPAAMLPWILLPLVSATRPADQPSGAGRLGRAAARSAVAVAAVRRHQRRRDRRRTGARGHLPAHPAPAGAALAAAGLVVPGRGAGHLLVVGAAAAAVQVRRLDPAVHRERGRHHVGDQPVRHPARHRELGRLPVHQRAALVPARLPDRHRGAAYPAHRAGRWPRAGRAGQPRAASPAVPALLAAGRAAHHLGRRT